MIKLNKNKTILKNNSGFTIVELLVVVIIIAILATLTIVAYNGIQKKAGDSALKSDLSQASKQLGIIEATEGSYPSDASSIKKSEGTNLQYTYDSLTKSYCLTASNQWAEYHITNTNTIPQDGVCDGHTSQIGTTGGGGGGAITNGSFIQTITSSNCPSTRTRAVDARDNHTYWVQELADGKCWMLTNLAYGGGGINTYSDTKTLQNGTEDSSSTFTEPKYYISNDANPTTEPTNPSDSTDGGATNPQYGYHYNWCAAMGSQTTTSACANDTTPAPNTSISVCPANWRLPTGGAGGEFDSLITALGTISVSSLFSLWHIQMSGGWAPPPWGFMLQGNNGGGAFWASNQYDTDVARYMNFDSFTVNNYSVGSKDYANSVRCIAQ